MSIQINEENGGKVLAIHVSGTLVKADYEQFVPEVDRGVAASAANETNSCRFPDPHTRPVLVDTPRADFMDSRTGYANRSNLNCGVWGVYDPSRLGLGRVRLGLCAGVVSDQ
ncbi:MAG: hypothetical protein PSV18_13235 [Methylobacter sp.]|nr:hypothetical protein [Candidatus Methylobacter titanis]